MTSHPARDRVLRVLRHEARLSNAQIAERLKLSEEEVARIIAEAERQGVIRGYYASILDEAFSETPVRALIEVAVAPERDVGFDRVARALSRFSEVKDVILSSGNHDLLLTVEGQTLQDVADFVAAKLATHRGVTSTRTHFVLKRYKEAGFQQVEDDEHYERLSVTP